MAKQELPRIAASQSFTGEEVDALDLLFRTVRRGGDARMLMRQPVFVKVQRKVEAMRARVAEVRDARATGRTEPAERTEDET